MNLFITRMIRAAIFDVTLFQELKSDKTALSQSILVVVLSGLMYSLTSFIASNSVNILFISILATVIFWFIWSYVSYIVGTKLFSTPENNSTFSEFARVVGFAACPGILNIAFVIPRLTFITRIWTFALMVIAVKTALNLKNPFSAIVICMIVPFLSVFFFIGLFFLILHDLSP